LAILAPVVAALSSVLVPILGGTLGPLAAQLIVAAGVAIGSMQLSRLLTPRQKPPGQEFEAKAGANIPAWCIYGRQKLAGQIMPPVQLANSVVHARNLGVGWHDALEFIVIDGQRCRFAGIAGQWSNSGRPFVGITGMALPEPTPADQVGDPPFTPGIQATGPGGSDWYQTLEFGPNVRVKFYDGRPVQTADPYLTANSQQDGQGAKHWTAAHAGNSVCRVLVEIIPDTNKNLSANPQLEFIVRGRRLWDPRKDPTYGGTGTHSRSDMSTWEWSDNVALAATDYRLGLWLNGFCVLGIGTPISRIRVDSRIAAANVCDTPRPLLDDREEPMWRIAAVISNERQHRDNLQIFMDAMAGWETERGGTYRLTAGGPQTPVVAISDTDLVKAPARYRAQKALSERYNGVEGKFADPFNGYELQDLPIRLSSADEAVDMGERRLFSLTLSQVPSETQAQHLMEIARRRQRLQATATVTLPPRLRDPEVMDTITWVSAWHQGEPREFQIQNPWRKNRDMTLTWGLVETSSSIWDWDPEEDQLSRLVAADLPSAVERVNTVAGFGVSPSYEEGADGQRVPVFIVSWAPITDLTVDAVIVRYRAAGTGEWAEKRFDGAATLAGGTGKIDSGIMAETAYEFEADIATTPPRYTTVVTPAPVTSDPNHVVKKAVVTEKVEPGGIDLEALEGRIQGSLRRADGIERRVATRLEEIARSVRAGSEERARQEENLTLRIGSESERGRAELAQYQQVVAGEFSSVVSQLTTFDAELETLDGALIGLGDAFDLLEVRVEEAEDGLSIVATDVEGLEVGVSSLSDTVSGQGSIISSALASLEALEDSVELVLTDVTELEGSVSSLSDTVSGQGLAISGLLVDVSDIEGDVSVLTAAQIATEAELDEVAEGNNANASSILSIISDVSLIDGELAALGTALLGVEAGLDDLSAGGMLKFVADVTPPTGATSGVQMLVEAADAGGFAEAGFEAYALAGGGGSPTGFFVLVGDRGYSRASGSSTLVKILDNDGKFVRLALADGLASKLTSYKRDGSEAAFSPGTGSNSGTNGNGWADIVMASNVALTANTAGVIGATGSKLAVRGDMTLNANQTNTDPLTNPATIDASDYTRWWYELWVRIVLRLSAGGSDIEIVPPIKFRSTPALDSSGTIVRSSMPELLNDLAPSGAAVIDAGTYNVILQHKIGRTGWPMGNSMTVKMRGVFTVEAKLL
jgi:hypothetical protein